LIRIMVADDHEVVRLGLKSSLQKTQSMVVIGEATTGAEAVQQAKRLKPDVVIMDVHMPKLSGTVVCAAIRSFLPKTKVVMFSAFSDKKALLEAKMAGASGYLLKSVSIDQLIESIKAVAAGDNLFDHKMHSHIPQLDIDADQTDNGGRDLIEELTDQEKRILELVAIGYTNRDIAIQLYLSEKTVRNYVSNILGKLQVANRTQAAAYVHKKDHVGGFGN
jgi:two-component system response regulator DevR